MLFRKFGKLMRCKTVDPETVVGAGGGVVDPPIKEPVTAETAMKKLSELTKAVQDDTITREKRSYVWTRRTRCATTSARRRPWLAVTSARRSWSTRRTRR
jgi:hypothetical protein